MPHASRHYGRSKGAAVNINLARRVAALEGTLTPHGKVVPIWAMRNGQPMTDLEIEQEISARHAAGAPLNTDFIPVKWMTETDAKKRGWES
jgi:hypothetical protein